jgi:hypothetical protein
VVKKLDAKDFAGFGDAESVDPDTLPGEIVEIREKISPKEEALSQVNQDIGSEKTQLD